jgi:hypothetical protein
MALLLFLGCLGGLIVQLERAGWSLRRIDRKPVYWSFVGMILAGAVWSRDALPASPAGAVLGALAGAGFLWGLWNERRR